MPNTCLAQSQTMAIAAQDRARPWRAQTMDRQWRAHSEPISSTWIAQPLDNPAEPIPVQVMASPDQPMERPSRVNLTQETPGPWTAQPMSSPAHGQRMASPWPDHANPWLGDSQHSPAHDHLQPKRCTAYVQTCAFPAQRMLCIGHAKASPIPHQPIPTTAQTQPSTCPGHA
jgi:hypothetical protein